MNIGVTALCLSKGRTCVAGMVLLIHKAMFVEMRLYAGGFRSSHRRSALLPGGGLQSLVPQSALALLSLCRCCDLHLGPDPPQVA